MNSFFSQAIDDSHFTSLFIFFFFFQAEDGIRDFCLSRGLGDVYKRQIETTRVSLCSPGCPGTHFVDQAGLELRLPLPP